MNSGLEIFLIILTVSTVTILLRVTPFVVMDKLSSNKYLEYIGAKMPIGIMVLLVAYTFLHIDFSTAPYGIPQVISSLVVFAAYWYSKNALAAIGIGLGIHLFIVNYAQFL
ncbi:branched-chain amino acid transporter permease [Vibrio spartinae]|uniref:Branched-chain amino acid transport protein (AzlD) n=1 Tax=Vibrio spartinae TaxID=1918945 RepID=A0A1N6M8L2_9VIBR|nr:AzlD domain-containing protein [Vibrio spartinae]SIO95798.1 Branched-chain amino acid transport protein (AzlD) [Vibrio spartinae]